jgi:hypothetical protein
MDGSKPVALITRVTAWIALAVEVVDFGAGPLGLKLSPNLHDGLEKFGILLFLISLVSWLETSNKGLEKLDRMGSELGELAEEARRMDLVARYGSGGVLLARLLNPQGVDRTKYPHCRAGGETLSHLLLNTYTQAAQEFHRLRTGDATEVKLTEVSIINLFLKNLWESLPRGSVWLGTSRLQDSGAWEEGSAEPSYYEFEGAVERRINNEGLTYLRVLCFENDERYARMAHIATRQVNMGLHLRSYVTQNMPNDMSLIWVPATKVTPRFDFEDPIGFLEKRRENFEPLCGRRFGIRADREVYTMDLVGPNTQEFVDLKIAFRQCWAEARRYESDHIVAKQAG